MLQYLKYLKELHKHYIFVIMFLFLIMFHINLISAVFDPNYPLTWKEDISQFKKLSATQISSACDKLDSLSSTEREKVVNEFFDKYTKEIVGRKLTLEGFASNDLKWDKNLKDKLIATDPKTGKKVLVDFNSIRESVTGVKYDEKTKTIEWIFNNGAKNVKLDEGYINKNGEHVFDTKTSFIGAFGSAFVPGKINNVDLMYGDGTIEFKNGEYKLSNNAAIRLGDNIYTVQDKDQPGFFRIEDKVNLGKNLLVDVIERDEKKGTESVAARISTSQTSFVCIFRGGSEGYKGSVSNPEGVYVDVSLVGKSITMNDKGKGVYSQVEIFKDFDSISGSGEQMWIKNGNSQLSFFNKGVYLLDGSGAGQYEVLKVNNLELSDQNKEGNIFSWRRFGDNPNVDFIDNKGRFSDTIANPTIDVMGRASSSPVILSYNNEFQQGYFKGSEEERLIAIAKDPNTILTMRFATNIPGQYIASEIVSQLERIYTYLPSGTSSDLLNAYNPKLDMRGLSAEQVSSLPPFNRLIYELSTTYSGDIEFGTPRQTKQNQGPFISGGLYQIDWRKEGVVVSASDGAKFVEGYSGVASEMFVEQSAKRMLSYKAKPEDYQDLQEKFQSFSFYPNRRGLIPMIRTGLEAYDYGVNRNNDKKEEVEKLRSLGRLP